MTTEQRLSDIESWINTNRDSVDTFNGRIGALAQRLAQVETITDATLTSNVKDLVDRVKMDEAKAATESARIDKIETDRNQMVNQLETIVTQIKDNMNETSKAPVLLCAGFFPARRTSKFSARRTRFPRGEL